MIIKYLLYDIQILLCVFTKWFYKKDNELQNGLKFFMRKHMQANMLCDEHYLCHIYYPYFRLVT